jgi:Secretion system C-terminal sorting domain
MKTFLLPLFFLLLMQYIGNAQTVRACMDTSSNYPNAVNFWLRADLTTPQDTCASSLQFSIAIPDTFSGIRPTDFTVDSSAWPGSVWYTEPPYLEAGYWHYDILTAYTPCMNYTANVDYFAMRVSPVGGTATPYDYYLLCLPDGGATTGGALFYHFGAWLSDGSSLFFSRPGTDSFNQLSYDLSGNSVGVGISWSKIIKPNTALAIEKIALASKWKNNNDVLLYWSIMGDKTDVVSYSISRSMDGLVYNDIATMEADKLVSFNFIDKNIANINTNNNVFYSIKATLTSGNMLQSNTTVIAKKSSVANTVFIYPIPVSTIVNVNLGSVPAQVILMANTGQILQTQSSQGGVHQMDVQHLANGCYMIKVVSQNGSVSIHKFNKI